MNDWLKTHKIVFISEELFVKCKKKKKRYGLFLRNKNILIIYFEEHADSSAGYV